MADEKAEERVVLGPILWAHAHFEAALAGLSEEQLVQPGLPGGWSAKDTLWHLIFWEERMLQLLQFAARGETPASLRAEDESSDEAVDRVNAEQHRRTKDRPLPETLAAYGRSFGQVLAQVSEVAADPATRARVESVLGGSLGEVVAPNTAEHYEEHAEVIRSWLATAARA